MNLKTYTSATVRIKSLLELIEFLNKVKDPGEWHPVEGTKKEESL